MKILILNFENAGWFHKKPFFYDDFMFDQDGQVKRSDNKKQYKEPITVHQVSNMLHVLFGERPSASLRRTLIKEIPEIKEIALNSWIKINDYCFTNNNGKITFFEEKLKTKKAVWNSWSPNNTLLYWDRIEKFLEKELYEDFVELVKKIFKTSNPCEKTLMKVIESLHNNFLENEDVKVFLEKLKASGKSPLYYTIKDFELKDGRLKNSDFNKNSRIMQTVCGGVAGFIRLNGKIIVPIEDEKWIEKMRMSQGFATILDGGFVTIEAVLNEYEFYDEHVFGFTKMNEISDELLNI